MTRTRNTNPNKVFRSPPHKGINVTNILIVMVSAMAWPAGYGLGVLLRPLAVGR